MSKFNQKVVTLLSWLKSLDAIDKYANEEDIGLLKRLDLSNRKLEFLHDDIGMLRSLTYLNLSNNTLTTLPESFAKLTTLLSLNLRRNKLSKLPDEVGSFALLSLNISANKIEDLSMIASCKGLRTVDISANLLHTIDTIFDHCDHLRSINAEANLLRTCQFQPNTLVALEILNLSSNRLEKLPCNITALESLSYLNLSNNMIDDDLTMLDAPELETLDISSNQIHTLDLRGLSELKSLVLDDNSINHISIDKDFAPQLQSVSAEGCLLKTFIFFPHKHLEYLCFSSNEIETIPDEITLYNNLNELDIDDNKIQYLPENFVKLELLRSLYIAGNKLDLTSKKRIADMDIEYCDIFVKKDIIVRKAQLHDIKQMAILLAQLFAIESDFKYDYKKHYHALKFMYDQNRADLIVAKYRNRVIGMVTLQELVSTAEGGITGQLEDLVVDTKFRKMGVGTRLVRMIFELAKERAYLRIQLGADKVNHKALRFYRQRGFSLSNLSLYHYVGIES